MGERMWLSMGLLGLKMTEPVSRRRIWVPNASLTSVLYLNRTTSHNIEGKNSSLTLGFVI